MADPSDTLAALSASLDNLEDVLAPLLANPLSQNIETLEPLQNAKLRVLIAYVAQDLVLIYLKTRGIDPSSHPVMEELKRIKSYMDKIKDIENPPARPGPMDVAAANRFIKHAIGNQSKRDAAAKVQQDAAGSRDVVVPFPKHIRFNKEKPSRNDAEESSSNEGDEDLMIVDEVEGEIEPPTIETPLKGGKKRKGDRKGKGKMVDTDLQGSKTHTQSTLLPTAMTPTVASSQSKKRRTMDPFKGFGEDSSPDPKRRKSTSPPST